MQYKYKWYSDDVLPALNLKETHMHGVDYHYWEIFWNVQPYEVGVHVSCTSALAIPPPQELAVCVLTSILTTHICTACSV